MLGKREEYGVVNIVAGDKILMEFSTLGDRFLSIVTDVTDDGRLLVYSPVPNLVVKRLRTDKKVFVRFAHEGELQGFKSKVLNDVESSNTILELQKPRNIHQVEERHEPRCACHFPATVVAGNAAAQAVVEDMSASCTRVRFLSDNIPYKDDTESVVDLTFHPFDVGEGYSVRCLVTKSFMKNNVHFAILRFRPEEKDARSRIARFVEAQVCCGIPRL